MTEKRSDANVPPVLEVIGVSKQFRIRASRRSRTARNAVVHAVDDVSLAMASGSIVAIVGESGSGKTTLGRIMTRLEHPDSGQLLLRGKPVAVRGSRALRKFRRDVQVVFQDPFGSLNAGHTVSYHIERPLLIHGIAKNRRAARERAAELLDIVNL